VRDLSKKAVRILVIQESTKFGGAANLNLTEETWSDEKAETVARQTDEATVLLVEDTEDNRQMMKRLLEMSGYRVVEATNGREAVEIASVEQPQIILMDLSLPLIDGLAATRRIRGLPGLSRVPIVAVSAHDTADFHSDALDAGCDAYITKPIDYSELEDIVSRLLSRDQ
jgi:two-component system cell cycle response regulator DivK